MYAVKSDSFTPSIISFTWIVQTQTGCAALAPAKMQGLGQGSANLENSTVSVETLSLNSWYTSLKLFRPNLFRMCIRCLAFFTEYFFLA